MGQPLCTIITATTGNPRLDFNIQTVRDQTYRDVQHLLVVDGPEHAAKVESIVNGRISHDRLDIIYLPYPTGKDRFNGHRIYGAGTYLAKGDYVIFLDDDNTLQPTHVEDCLKVIRSGKDWAYSFRNIVQPNGFMLCQDDCESLGKWPSVIHSQDYFIDVNCYFLPKMISVAMSPVWYCKFREPGQPEIDRKMMGFLRQCYPNFDCTYNYTVNYTVGNTGLSVTSDFFKQGNAEMLRRYNGNLPWHKK